LEIIIANIFKYCNQKNIFYIENIMISKYKYYSLFKDYSRNTKLSK